MRITVWNINGLRTLKGYQPWYKLPDWEACLEHLGADIACFQETKMTRKQLTEPMCILPSYNAFFNFHPTKGYSGTVTYVRKSVSIPLKAEQGITGRVPITNVSSNPLIPNEPIGCVPADTRDDVEPQIWTALDEEGRCVVLDLGLFVLFNVYCPNETGPERLDYKMTYYQCLAERAHRLIQAGRQVMIVGDMNIIRDPIDHCDPEQSMKEHGWEHFHQHPARSWFQTFLAPHGKFHDVGRAYHPERKRMFTCWNTLIDARPANYGVRLDYTLVTEGLLPWINGADIQADIYGSDHCPIYVDLYDEREIDGKTVKLKDLMHGGADRLPPALAACHYDEFSGKQRKLASFFGSSKKTVPAKSSSPATSGPASAIQVVAASDKESSDSAGLNGNSSLAGQNAQKTPSKAESGGEEGSLADALFSLHSQQEGLNIEVRMQTSDAAAAPSSQSIPKKTGATPSASAPVASTSAPTSSLSKVSASQPSPNAKRNGSSPKRTPSATKGKDSGKAKNGASLKGQMSLQTFFAKPSSGTPTARSSGTKTENEKQDAAEPTAPHLKGCDDVDTLASTKSGTSPVLVSDEDEDISEFQDTLTSTSQGPARSSEQSAADRVRASQTWGAIFSPIPAPLCRNHSEPCRAWTVNKPGPNHGRKFWLCNRPVGPGYEKSGRAKGDVNPEFRCNFFLWDSDLRSKKKQSTTTTEGDAVEGKFFTEVGRERGQKKGRDGEQVDPEELGGPRGPHKRVKTGEN
ncbi:related to APN2 - AP endonuclease, exonuclease III homolog [Ustilago trichophora]|uniref:DNA-(apurinic or apyrimidinic site) endonuclease n=1 Tax=Ustilago trichophora TaxID=86804 RepID=A0A5C3DTH7_9BASI|nr:related to APN2 - AP endonuclease, exonuclease III homolog [Ustilago trichophora]